MHAWANLILYLHFLFVAAVVVPVLLLPLGAFFGWRWVRNRRFRFLHLGMMGFVAAETVLGVVCPLTWLEDFLRGEAASDRGFLSHWVSRLLFHELPPWVFTVAYLGFFGLIVVLWLAVPPAEKR